MNHIRHIRYLVSFLGTLAVAMLGVAVSAPSAFAMRVPASGGTPGVASTGPTPSFSHTVVASGMPGWQVTLIAAVVAVLAATIAVAVDRARAAHRTEIVPAT